MYCREAPSPPLLLYEDTLHTLAPRAAPLLTLLHVHPIVACVPGAALLHVSAPGPPAGRCTPPTPPVQVHTPYTARAKELQLLHAALCRSPGRLEERLDALLHVKWTVKEFECDLTREIVQLIDREADLLNR